MKKIRKINDFVVRFANANGSGSASANNLFSKAIFRMGIPVSGKNIFPSNIKGLPTWYEVRISERGYMGRREEVDFAVAINGQTLKDDYQQVAAGGYFLYDSTRPLGEEFNRDDILEIGIPLSEMASSAFSTARLQQLLKNIIYIGALSYLIDLDFSILSESLEQQFSGKAKLADINREALKIGFSYASEHFPASCDLQLESRSDLIGDAILIDGNSATGLGAVYGGATVAAWYPITPSTSVIEAFEKNCHKFRVDSEGKNKFAIIQAEDELAACGIAIGANWSGARAFTATSGPGLSLMTEFLGLAYFAEIPTVLIDVQRAGPSTGMPTRSQQADILAAALASHGDSKHILLLPETPTDCFQLTVQAFDLADRLQTPVIILSDLDLGMNDHICPPLQWDDSHRYDRGKIITGREIEELEEKWGRYLDLDGDGICYRSLPGSHPEHGAYFTRGTSHDEYSGYDENDDVYRRGMERLLRKWETARRILPPPAIGRGEADNPLAILFFGSSAPACREALDELSARGIKLNSLQIYAFPFHQEVQSFLDQHQKIFVIEQNRDAQMRSLLLFDCRAEQEQLLSVLSFDGLPITANNIIRQIEPPLQAMGAAL
ncbi:2-oxoacid:acceptor oxidoreductase subunit alpha [Desulfotalea psychrophila]|uniref:Related to 2-oxoglutarate synthase, subunit KorA n=1 Tax=Desulfotalea psychrophila (strain LSv54 / DSM 12343) TaxID=177439 RepID=Q6APV3_DESPS|nr:2-oxoacid:acceptor oxidoreductase subunit alpha [Desulfotalea psychrophila]CAG35621.1 related to 2-oxoglutarate synthase, subunit KorA [Desulfotalea psychrophila LSv54]